MKCVKKAAAQAMIAQHAEQLRCICKISGVGGSALDLTTHAAMCSMYMFQLEIQALHYA